jgi:flagellum-specific ATP synthase
MMPRLLERAGGSEHGSITGLYTVLVEGEDHNEPVADTARSILDGHIVLDRRLATAGHFPSIDVLESVSRVVTAVTTPEQQQLARRARQLLAARRDVRELVEIGAYVAGTNPRADQALASWPQLEAFLQQDMSDQSSVDSAWDALRAIVAADPAALAAPLSGGGAR